jgi:MutS domain V
MADPVMPQSNIESTSLWQRGLSSFYKTLGLSLAPILDWTFSESQIACYANAKINAQTNPQTNVNPISNDMRIDAQTWKDLRLTSYRDSLAQATSVFGQQALHYRLCAGNIDTQTRVAADVHIKHLLANPTACRALSAQCLPLRALDTEVCDLLFVRNAALMPAWVPYSSLLPISFALSVFAFIFTPFSLIAAVWFITTAIAIIAAQQSMSETLDAWNREAKSLREMLAFISRLNISREQLDNADASHLEHVEILKKTAGKINRRITRTPIATAFPVLGDYFDWFLFTNVGHYVKSQTVIAQEKLFLQTCFETVANLEANLAVARHLAGNGVNAAPRFCWASKLDTATFSFTNLVHPLLPQATPLTISVNDKSIVLTGQNGIGKSTLMKAIGLSLVTYRAFGFCYANAASASSLPVYVSLNNEDNLSSGESLYIAELRRARELLQASQTLQGCVCLIDEIFRGTNHLEAVATAGAVLNRLSQRATVIVSSHHAVLAPLLAASFTPYFLGMDNDDIRTLRLLPGILANTNGIALLSKNGFDADIEADAHAVLNWISDYLAHPTENPNIFKVKVL